MICSAILVAALLAAASEETINVAAWIEVDSLVVGQEYEFFVGGEVECEDLGHDEDAHGLVSNPNFKKPAA